MKSHPQTDHRMLAAARRLSLRGALGYLAKAAMELHQYRYLRTRMLHDSLSRQDRRGCRDFDGARATSVEDGHAGE